MARVQDERVQLLAELDLRVTACVRGNQVLGLLRPPASGRGDDLAPIAVGFWNGVAVGIEAVDGVVLPRCQAVDVVDIGTGCNLQPVFVVPVPLRQGTELADVDIAFLFKYAILML